MTDLLLGTVDGLWRAGAGETGRLAFAGREVRGPVREGTVLWAILDRTEVCRAEGDPANGWDRRASVRDSEALCLLPSRYGLFVGTSEPGLRRLGPDGLEAVESIHDAEGREAWTTPWGGPPSMRSLAVDDGGTLFANVHVGGILRSTDGGASWEPTIDPEADVHQVIVDIGSGLVLAATARGLAASEDRCRSWRFLAEGLHGDYCRAVAVASEVVLVTASTGPRTNRAAVYRVSVTLDRPLERCRQGLPDAFPANIDTHCLHADGAYAAFATPDGRAFLSRDAGGSWEAVADGVPEPRTVLL